MATNDNSSNQPLNSITPPTPITKKKPYEKPSFRFEKVFVTTALSCGKTPNSGLQCNTNAQAS
jgi:hypothetical protein